MRSLLAGTAVVVAVLAPWGADAALADNPWLERRVWNIAHQGGENEAPSDTMFAFKTAMAKGADMLELDVHATADGEIVVLHDATIDRTTNGSGQVDELTLAEIQAFDAAHWFVPVEGTTHSAADADYIYRGIATGTVAPPAGFSASDFRIPTLRAVLETFPGVPTNIEIKNYFPNTAPYEKTLADLLDEFGRTDDVIVVSFFDQALELFKLWAPDVHTATATVETALFHTSARGALPGLPNPRYVALQVPVIFDTIPGVPVEVVNEDFIADAHANGLAVHVWTINDVPTMCALIAMGADGIMTDFPTVLEHVLADPATACAA
ncbi:MAG: glycerophosphodiester phosphodiesterase [Actinomycetota bacterium]